MKNCTPFCPYKNKNYCPEHSDRLSKDRLSSNVGKNDLSQLSKEATFVFNQYIRLRDKDKKCACGCGRKVEQALHLFPAGSYSGVRFDEKNVNGGAKVCNYYKNSSAVDPEYLENHTKVIGQKRMDALTKKAHETKLYRWTRGEYENIIETYGAKVKLLKSDSLSRLSKRA